MTNEEKQLLREAVTIAQLTLATPDDNHPVAVVKLSKALLLVMMKVITTWVSDEE